MNRNSLTNLNIFLYYTLFFLTPFIVLPITSELFEFNKIIFIYAITSLIATIWLVDSLKTGYVVWKKSPFDIPIALFYCSQVLSFLFSIDKHTSFFGYYGRFNGGLLSLSVYIFLYYAFIIYVVPNKAAIRRLLGLTSLAIILVFLWGVPGLFNRDLSCLLFVGTFDNSCWTAQFRPAERMFSTLGQPNWLGSYAAISFFSSLYLLFTTKKKSIAIFSSIAVVAGFCAILFSRSRSSLLSITPGLFLFAVLAIYLRKSLHEAFVYHNKIIATLVVVLTICLFTIKTGVLFIDKILSFQLINKPKIQQEISPPKTFDQQQSEPKIEVGGVTESLDIRKIVWEGAFELGKQYPLFGTGLETFGYAYYSVRPKEHNLTSEWDYLYNKAHNEFLNVFATSGYVGLATYLLLFIWILAYFGYIFVYRKNLHVSDRLFILLFFSIYLSIGITNFFGFSTTTINLFWYILPAVILSLNQTENSVTYRSPISLQQWFMGGAVSIIMLNYLVSYWYADYLYAQSDALAKNGALERSVLVLDKARSLRYEHVYDDKLSYILAQVAYAQLNSGRSETIKPLLEQSDKLNMDSIRASQFNVLYWKTRVKNQYLFYQATLDKKHLFTGLSALDESYKLAPTDPKIPYFASTYYTLLYDDEKDPQQRTIYREKSVSEIDKAIALKNNYIDAYTLKIQLLKKYQLKDELKRLLEFYLKEIAPNDQSAQEEYNAL